VYRFLLTLAVMLVLLGLGIIGYGLYIALAPSPTCQTGGVGCGAPPGTPRT
jgi:hypothetical protein